MSHWTTLAAGAGVHMDCKRSAASRLHHNALHAMRHPLCLAGKVPKLHQFALTPQQLVMREMQQEDELDSSSGSGSLRAAEGAAARRRSLALGSADELQMLAAQLQTRTRWVVCGWQWLCSCHALTVRGSRVCSCSRAVTQVTLVGFPQRRSSCDAARAAVGHNWYCSTSLLCFSQARTCYMCVNLSCNHVPPADAHAGFVSC